LEGGVRILDGLEMVCFCKSKHFELEYGGKGTYVDARGEEVDDLIDMACYICTASYYTRDSDMIPFCPNCGQFEKKRFDDQKEIAEFLRGQDFKWLTPKGLKAFLVQKPGAGWQLKFAANATDLQRSGAFDKVIDFAG
jgi:hypothetical protein